MSFDFAPRGWVSCNGQILQIRQNQALFALLGNAFGGDGRDTFALPDLRDRAVRGADPSSGRYPIGEVRGEREHALTLAELPLHNHELRGSKSDGNTQAPAGNVPARSSNLPYAPPDDVEMLAATTAAVAGGSRPHTNMPPYVTLTFAIALIGIFPSRG